MTDDDIKEARALLRAWNEAGASVGSISMAVDLGRTIDALEASRAQVAALTVERDAARAAGCVLNAEQSARLDEMLADPEGPTKAMLALFSATPHAATALGAATLHVVIKERDEALDELADSRREVIDVMAERDAALARAEAAERECESLRVSTRAAWLGSNANLLARATQAEAKLAALMPLCEAVKSWGKVANEWGVDAIHTEDASAVLLAALDKEATP